MSHHSPKHWKPTTTRPSPGTPGADMMSGLSKEGVTINLEEELSKWKVPSAVKIEDVKAVSSYTWAGKASSLPTIIVPGSPKEWLNRPLPFTVPKDSGIQYVNQNAYKLPEYQLVPLISAVQHLNPTYNFGELDLITDRNNLRKLIRWMGGKSQDRDFRIDMHLVGKKTLVLERWDERTTVFGGTAYGHSFEEASTRHAEGCEEGTGHHRIISYTFSGLKVMIRFEVDAYLVKGRSYSSISDTGLDDLSATLGGLSIKSTDKDHKALNTCGTKHSNQLIQIKDGGKLVPQDCLIEMTTRSTKSFEMFNWADPYPQILLSQTPHLYIAVHNFGKFQQIHKYELGKGLMKSVEEQCDKHIQSLRAFLDGLVTRVKNAGNERGLSLVCKDGILKVHERIDPKPCFPADIIKYFEGGSKEAK